MINRMMQLQWIRQVRMRSRDRRYDNGICPEHNRVGDTTTDDTTDIVIQIMKLLMTTLIPECWMRQMMKMMRLHL